MGRAIAMSVDTKISSPQPHYEFEGDVGHGVHAFIINSMGSSLPGGKRDSFYYKTCVTASDLGGYSVLS